HNLDVGHQLAQAARRLDPVDAGHLQVHQHDVRPLLLRRLDRRLAVAVGPDEVDVVGPAQELLEPAPHDRMVVCDEDADHEVGPRRRIVVPRPGSESIVSVAPRSRARSARRLRPRWPWARAERRARGSKPMPSSVTASSYEPFSPARLTATWDADACVATFRTASWAVRNTRDSCSTDSVRSGEIWRSVAAPFELARASTSESAASSPAPCRLGG